jgi:zinc/manganese transport system substrate-binding protein
MLKKLGLLTAFSLLLTGCSTPPEPWTAGTGPIKIVTSTNVWGSVANLVAGDTATVTSLIYNSNQDPHSFEASAQDQLDINNADIVIMNGGGYDDFVEKLVEADPTPAILVNAYMAAGEDDGRNEHIWYDVDQVGDVAAVIGGAIETIDPSKSDQVWASVDEFRSQLASRKEKLDIIKNSNSCGKVFATEPLIDYILEDAGCKNVTPAAYSEAIEEERDVPPAVMEESKKILAAGVEFVAVNESVSSSQIDELTGSKMNLATFAFSELLHMDPDTGEYEGNFFDLIDGTLMALRFDRG